MNSRILLALITIAVLSSCSTAYKAQTPDDVYYSPARPQAEYVAVETKKDREAYRYEDDYSDDRYLRWKVRNRSRWSSFDNYSYDLYDYRFGNSYANNYTWYRPNYWHNYWAWNYGYNPYSWNVIVVNPKSTPAYNQVVRNYRPGTYKTTYGNTNNNNSKFKTSPGVYRPTGSYNNSNNRSNTLGNSIKKVFDSNNSNNSNNSSSDSRPTRTYTPSSNSSSNSSGSSGSSSGSGSGVSRPSRGGN